MAVSGKSNSSSSPHLSKTTETSPILGPSRSASVSRSTFPLYKSTSNNNAGPQEIKASTTPKPHLSSSEGNVKGEPSRYVSPPFASSSEDDVEAQYRSRADSSNYDQAGQLDELEGHLFDPHEITASTPLLPGQQDPAKPLGQGKRQIRQKFNRLKNFTRRNHGLLLLSGSMLFFSTMNFFFKLLTSLPPEETQPISALEIIFIRMSITWLGCIAFMLATGVEHPFLGPKGVRSLLALRGFSGFFGLFGIYYSLQYLSLSDSTVITFLSPLATGCLGYVVLGERFTWKQVTSGIISLVGVALIARPAFLFGRKLADEDPTVPTTGNDQPSHNNASTQLVLGSHDLPTLLSRSVTSMIQNATFQSPFSSSSVLENPNHKVTEAQRLIAVCVALLGVCGAAGAYITIRAIGQRASATHSVAYFSLYSSIVSMALMYAMGIDFVLPNSYKWCALLVCIGLFGLIAQILLAMGLQKEKAGRAISATYLQIVFATFYQLFFLHVPINPLSGLGIAIIMTSAIFVTLSK